MEKEYWIKDTMILGTEVTAIPSSFCDEDDDGIVTGNESERRSCVLLSYTKDGERYEEIHFGIDELPETESGLLQEINDESWYEVETDYMALATCKDEHVNRLFDESGIRI